MTTVISKLDRESATGLYVASTVEKFEDERAYDRAWSKWSEASQMIWDRCAAMVQRHEPCSFCEAPDLSDHHSACPLWVYRPVPGGNPQAGSLIRDLIEQLGEEAFSFEEQTVDGITTVKAKLKLSPARYRKLLDTEIELRLLEALEGSTFQLGAKNLLLNEGITELLTIITSASGTKWDSTNANIGVGNSATAAAATDTGLLGASTSYQGMVATYPSVTAQTAKWKSSYAAGVAEFAWAEWTVCNTNANSGKNLNRKAETLGTKPAGVIWTLEVQITFS